MEKRIIIPSETTKKVEEIYNIANPHSAVVGYLDLLANYHLTETNIPTSFCSTNGKPERWTLESYKPFNQINESGQGFLFNNGIFAWITSEQGGKIGKNINLINPKVLSFFSERIEELPYLIKESGNLYLVQTKGIVEHLSPEVSGIREGIIVSPLKKEVKKSGLENLSF